VNMKEMAVICTRASRDGLVVSVSASSARGPEHESWSDQTMHHWASQSSGQRSGWSGQTLPERNSYGHAVYSQLPGASV
jgi:hypothetical protein